MSMPGPSYKGGPSSSKESASDWDPFKDNEPDVLTPTASIRIKRYILLTKINGRINFIYLCQFYIFVSTFIDILSIIGINFTYLY